MSGEALAQEISNFIKSIGLCMEDCHGQGYDGAENMAGRYSRIATRIAYFTNPHEKRQCWTETYYLQIYL